MILLFSAHPFAFVVSFHIIFPAFTIGLAAWLATIEGMRLATGNTLYRRVFDFWLKVFALSFGMGVVSGIVMAFQFGTNWSVLAEVPDQFRGRCSAMKALPRSCWRRRSSASCCWPQPRGALVLLSGLLHGFHWDNAVVALDPLQQQLDAGAGWLCGDRRQAGAD